MKQWRVAVVRGVVLGLCACSLLTTLSGCALQTRVQSSLPVPLETRQFSFDAQHDDVVGEVQTIIARHEDTFSDIARRFNLGYEELVSANPGVDPWLPREGTEIVLPTQFVLPDAPRQGIVVNLAAMRLFYFPPAKAGEAQQVITHPLGIGRVEWKTPVGSTRIASKQAAPTWIPPASIRKEHAALGDPLPAKVPPGPDNPLGTHVLKFGWPSYSLHGTDKPYSIGLRGSHGCLRMYPEDIVTIYEQVPVGTAVRVVNQPQLFGWRGEVLYLQTYPPLEDDRRGQQALLAKALKNALASANVNSAARQQQTINRSLLDEMIATPRALTVPITQSDLSLPAYIARAMRVENPLPASEPVPAQDAVSVP